MANVQKCVADTEAKCDALVGIIDKALGYPKRGTHVGGGKHAVMPETWDGTGPTPPGWTKNATVSWVASAASAAVPVPDSLATQLQRPESLARLSVAERNTLSAAIAGRVNVDTEAGGHTPKASAASQAAERAGT